MSAEETTQKYTKLQGELEELIVARQKLETQLQENKIVSDEFSSLKDDATVYKLTGGVLLPVEQFEAKGTLRRDSNSLKSRSNVARPTSNPNSKNWKLQGANL